MAQQFKILVATYSQSGQMDEITENFISPLENVEIDRVRYTPEKPYPFPWTSAAFFDTMPESVLEKPARLNKIEYKYPKYDLVIFAYQPWYLSPSIPATSLLMDEEFRRRLNGTNVITIIGSRNMWLNSQESVKRFIKDAGGTIVANLPFSDRNQNQLSAVTILHWMLTGKKTRKFGILPIPGVSDKDILKASDFGKMFNRALQDNKLYDLQSEFVSTGFISLPIGIMFIEKKAKRLFRIWANLITKYGKTDLSRKRLILAYKYYLFIALFIVAPIVMLFYMILIVPFTRRRINREKQVYLRQIDSKCPYL
jgi:hypothetical protein